MLSNQGNRITIILVFYFFVVAYTIITQELSLLQAIGSYVVYCAMGYGVFGILDVIYDKSNHEN